MRAGKMTLVACVGLLLVPATMLLGAQAQQADGGAAFGAPAPDGSTPVEWRGRTVLRLQGVCLAGQPCVGRNETEAGSFLLPAPGSAGVLAVTWRPVNASLDTLRVRVAGVVAEGLPPLELHVPGLAAGEYDVLVEPVRPLAGAWEQPVDWTARFLVAPLPESVDTTQVSSVRVAALCALGTCDAATRETPGGFLLPWATEDAVLEATWDRRKGPVTLQVGAASATGETPLRVDLPRLERGAHEVHVLPESSLPGRLDVTWTLRASPAP